MKKSSQKIFITTLVMFVAAIGIVIVYFNLTKAPQIEDKVVPDTEQGKILSRDLETNYPETPREVLKFYGRITSCLYKEELSDNEIEQLGKKLRELFDNELLENNPEEAYIKTLKKDVEEFRSIDKKIRSYQVDSANSIEYSKDGKYATCIMLFLTQEKEKQKKYHKVYERFILRQDTDENWKILGWEKTKPKDMDED